jgi:hypothetical protein
MSTVSSGFSWSDIGSDVLTSPTTGLEPDPDPVTTAAGSPDGSEAADIKRGFKERHEAAEWLLGAVNGVRPRARIKTLAAIGLLACIVAAPLSAGAEWVRPVQTAVQTAQEQPQSDLGEAIYQLLVRQQTQAAITEQQISALNNTEVENRKTLIDILVGLRQLRAQTKGGAQ